MIYLSKLQSDCILMAEFVSLKALCDLLGVKVAVYAEFVSRSTAILIIIEGQLQDFQRFSSSKPVLKTVESCFMALIYYENGSMG